MDDVIDCLRRLAVSLGYCCDYLLQLFVLIPTSWPRPHTPTHTHQGRKYEITNVLLATGISMRVSMRISHVLEYLWLLAPSLGLQGAALHIKCSIRIEDF